jgi:hypothetical protein
MAFTNEMEYYINKKNLEKAAICKDIRTTAITIAV